MKHILEGNLKNAPYKLHNFLSVVNCVTERFIHAHSKMITVKCVYRQITFMGQANMHVKEDHLKTFFKFSVQAKARAW